MSHGAGGDGRGVLVILVLIDLVLVTKKRYYSNSVLFVSMSKMIKNIFHYYNEWMMNIIAGYG